VTAVIQTVQPKAQCTHHTDELHSSEGDTTGFVSKQGLTIPPTGPTQYRLSGRRFLQVKRPNQQYQSTEGTHNNNQ